MLGQLFLTFFKIGLFTFGGGYAMIAQIRETVVQQRRWLTEEELMEVIAIAESTPGPIAINLATYVGFKKGGFRGALCATLGVVIPSVAIIFALSLFLDSFMENKYVAYAFKGIKCAVAFLILKAGLDMLGKLPRKGLSLCTFAVVLGAMLALELLSVSFSSIFFILAGGILGIVVYALAAGEKGAEEK